MPVISIIVPIYKVEQYLKKCVNSILAQTFTDFELILVDDGSPDNCGVICDEYAKQDNRVIVLHKPNGGLSDARNAGIDIAKGEYITFIDSDDSIDENMYTFLYKDIINENADIAIGGVLKVIDGKIHQYYCSGKYYVQGGSDALCTLLRGKDASVTAWGKLYRRKLFDEIRYPNGVTPEDVFIIGDVILKADKVVFDLRGMYLYLIRYSSISNSSFNKKFEESRYEGYMYNLKLAENKAKNAIPLVKYRLWWCSRETLKALSKSTDEVRKENIDLIIKHKNLIIKDWRKIVLCKHTPLHIKIVTLIGGISPRAYGFFARTFR